MTETFVKLHIGDSDDPIEIWVAVNDIRTVQKPENISVKGTLIIFKAGGCHLKVLEDLETVIRMCGFGEPNQRL